MLSTAYGRRPSRKAVRLATLAGVIAWHGLLLALLLRPQPRPIDGAGEPVMTWLNLPLPAPRPEPAPAVPRPAPPAARSARRAAAPTVEAAPAPAPGTAITLPTRSGWYAQASEAARARHAPAPPGPRSLDADPEPFHLPPPDTRPRAGDEVDKGDGSRVLYLSENCTTEIPAMAPAPGEFRPMIVRCRRKPPPIDAGTLGRRKPASIQLPRDRGTGAGEARPGPAMGGTPLP